MRVYALTELHDPEAIELFITEKDARRALEDCLRNEPQWRGILEVKAHGHLLYSARFAVESHLLAGARAVRPRG